MLTRREGLVSVGLGLVAASLPGEVRAQASADQADTGAPLARFVFEAQVDIAENEDLGSGPLGGRRIVPILGGTFAGPDIRGTVRPGGADRQLIRDDGVRHLHALYELETDDGAVLTISNRALIHDPEDGPRYAFSTLEITAPEGRHDWLNRRVFVGTVNTMRPERQAVRIRVFALA
jgi:hypothetical protein